MAYHPYYVHFGFISQTLTTTSVL